METAENSNILGRSDMEYLAAMITDMNIPVIADIYRCQYFLHENVLQQQTLKHT